MNEEAKTRFLHLDKRKLQIIAFAILLLAIVVAVIILLYPQKTTPIDHFYKALQKGNVEELQKCMPEDAWSYAAGKYAESDFRQEDFQDYMAEVISETNTALVDFYGDKLKISYTVTNNKEYDNELLAQLASVLSEKFALDQTEITEACEITVDTTSKGSKGKQTEEGDLFVVYKYNGKWYLFFDPLSGAN